MQIAAVMRGAGASLTGGSGRIKAQALEGDAEDALVGQAALGRGVGVRDPQREAGSGSLQEGSGDGPNMRGESKKNYQKTHLSRSQNRYLKSRGTTKFLL